MNLMIVHPSSARDRTLSSILLDRGPPPAPPVARVHGHGAHSAESERRRLPVLRAVRAHRPGPPLLPGTMADETDKIIARELKRARDAVDGRPECQRTTLHSLGRISSTWSTRRPTTVFQAQPRECARPLSRVQHRPCPEDCLAVRRQGSGTTFDVKAPMAGSAGGL